MINPWASFECTLISRVNTQHFFFVRKLHTSNFHYNILVSYLDMENYNYTDPYKKFNCQKDLHRSDG